MELTAPLFPLLFPLTTPLLLILLLTPPAASDHRAELEVFTNGICLYGNTLHCCWGWTRETGGLCRPVCESGCEHGECVAPDHCKCHPGYTGKTCNQDVNECGLKPRPCKHRCINMMGTFKCYCLSGYMLMNDGTCRNAWTCATANCQYGCAMMKGEVVCQCPSRGLRLGPDQKTCVDIDECALGVAKCPKFRKCVNTFGSYICKCHKGFKLQYINGKYQCTDINAPFICQETPNSKKCKCKGDKNRWSHDCQPLFTVTVDPPRPPTTPIPTTSVIMTTSGKTTSQSTTITPYKPTTRITPTTPTTTPTTTTTTPTATTITTTQATTTTPTTPTTTTTPTTAAITTTPTTTTPKPTTTTTPKTTTTQATTTTPTTTQATTTTQEPTTTTQATTTTTQATTTTTQATTTTPTTTMTTTTQTTTTTPVIMTTTPITVSTKTPTTLPLLTTTLDNRIQDLTQKPRGDVHIPRNPDLNVFDFFDIELGNTAEFARDDPAAGSLSCTFDLHGLCSWMSDQEGDLHWETVADPAGGRYLRVPEPKVGRSFRGARLTIHLAPPKSPPWKGHDLCLEFRHLLEGQLIGSLQLFVRKGRGQSPAVWTRTGGRGWRHTQITLWGRGMESVVFKGERRRGRSGQIAIDDIHLNHGVCKNKNQT